ncbi:MAG: DUF2288 family protein [Halieaceae bacterium]
MAELDALREEIHAQTAQISWRELQPHYARGAVILVEPGMSLVDAAIELRQDNKACFQGWIDEGKIGGVSDELGQQLFELDPMVWAVVVAPWVLVQRQAN